MQNSRTSVEAGLGLRTLADVALLASVQSVHFIERDIPHPDSAVVRYWQHSRNLQQRWLERLEHCRHALPSGSSAAGQELSDLLTELFVAEVLTRVWAGILIAADRRWNRSLHEPLARNVFLGQLQARRRALALMLAAPSPLMNLVVSLDRVRRRCERWTDLLLGHLVARFELTELVFHPDRARDFGTERQQPSASVELLMQAGLQLAFGQHVPSGQPLDREYVPLLRSILACLPAAAFGTEGSLKSSACARVERSSRLPESPASRPSRPSSPSRPGMSFQNLRQRFGTDDN